MVVSAQSPATTGDLARKLRRELDLALARTKVPGPTAPPPPSANDDIHGHLSPISGLLAHRATAKPGPLAFAINSVRSGVKALIRPWLDFQTRFNHQVIESLARLSSVRRQTETIANARLDKADTAVLELREQVNYLRAELTLQAAAHRQTNTKLGEVSAALRQAHADLAQLALAEQSRRTQPTDAAERGVEATREDEQLVHAVVTAVNRELGHEGAIAQAGLWFNPPVGVRLNGAHAPVMTAVTERILEQAFVHTRLPRPPARVLDMGCAESLMSLELASTGYQVVGVDLRRLPLEHPNFTQVQANLGDLPFPDGSFDIAVCLSTVEHVGLGWYTNGDKTTDVNAIREAVRTLKPGGTFVLTVPFGRATITPLHRVYDRPQLDELLTPLSVRELAFGVRDGEVWTITADETVAGRADSAERVSAVALVVAEKP